MISFKSLLAAAVLSLGASSAHAVTFTVDAANSSVSLTETFSGLLCDATNCGVTAELSAGLGGTTFDLNNPGDSNSFDFLKFTGTGSGLVSYDVTATLAFSPPELSVTSGGSGGAFLIFGSIIGAALTWNNVPAVAVLADGTELNIDFEDGIGLFLGNSVTTSASVRLDEVAPSPVPLPASALMLLLGLGGLAGASRFKKKAA